MKQSVRHRRRTLALMADAALQRTKAETFEEVRPILAQLSERSLTPQVQRENIREGARQKDHSRIRTFQKIAPKGTFWKRIFEAPKQVPPGSIFRGGLRQNKVCREALQRGSSRKLFKEALQGSSSPTRKEDSAWKCS